ncbi:MAG: DsrH/TusB family sulfur metabolism protein [Acidobacteriota bacterium]
MGNLYLVDRPFGENGLNLAAEDTDAKIVLIQDGVHFDCGSVAGIETYAIRRDAERRGQAGRLPAFVELIDYGQLVDLIAAHKVINFA